MVEIIKFPKLAEPLREDSDSNVLTASEVLGFAQDKSFKDVLVIGRLDDGEFYYASSSLNIGKLLVYLEKAKIAVLSHIEN